MKNKIVYWEREGLLLSVPEDLKMKVVEALEKKADNVRKGIDYKDRPEDYDQVVIDILHMNKEFFNEE